MISRILYINLNKRPDRNEHTLQEINNSDISKYKIEIERVEGIDGSIANLDDYKSLFTENALNQAKDTRPRQFEHGFYMTKGAVGCALSHHKVYQKILSGNDDYVLVLEDDINIDKNVIEEYNQLLPYIPEFDILYLGYHYANKTEKINEYISQVHGTVYGCFAMVINKKCVEKLINLFPINQQIDSELAKFNSHSKVYYLNKQIIKSAPSHVNKLGTNVQVIEGFGSKDFPIYYILIPIFLFVLFLCIIYFYRKHKN
jgi:GR25 family glycosyltransferase involved in LPS biosynthesis